MAKRKSKRESTIPGRFAFDADDVGKIPLRALPYQVDLGDELNTAQNALMMPFVRFRRLFQEVTKLPFTRSDVVGYFATERGTALEESCELTMAEAEQLLRESGTKRTDGPIADGFRWRGSDYIGLTRKPWLVIDFLWKQTSRVAAFGELAEPVWGDRGRFISTNKVGSARREVNKFFKDHGIPFRVTINGRTVTLMQVSEKS